MRDLADLPLGPHETESPDPFRVEISCANSKLWKVEAFYGTGPNPAVSVSWHRTRAEALKEAQSFA